MRRSLVSLLCVWAIFAGSPPSSAEELLMVRSSLPFAEAMLALQDAIREHGYQLTRVQRVDIGLTASGFETDKYRVVFFGDPQEVPELAARYPELIPYLPIKVAIFGEDEETLVVTINPRGFRDFYPEPELGPVFARWEKDLYSIFDRLRNAD
jgi:uncharacterized protein (DUF302 family)